MFLHSCVLVIFLFVVQENAAQREKDDLVQEMKIMQEIGSHPNVVTILGVCTEQGENVLAISAQPGYLRSSRILPGQIQTSIKCFMTR